VNPGITLADMQKQVIEMMEEIKLPEDILEAAVARLPHLKRWRKVGIE
jgi:hypothetical protein